MKNTEEKRQALMALMAMALNGFFILYIIATLVAFLALKACGQA